MDIINDVPAELPDPDDLRPELNGPLARERRHGYEPTARDQHLAAICDAFDRPLFTVAGASCALPPPPRHRRRC